MNNEVLLVGIALILMHEMDAIRCKEWRIIPGLSYLNEKLGFKIFILVHLPIFYWALSKFLKGSESFIIGFDIFLIIHLMLHIIFIFHKKNEFKDLISWSIIIGAGPCGAIDLYLNPSI